MDVPLCTCGAFCQYAECEHHSFVASLRSPLGKRKPNLDDVPETVRRGRRRLE